MAASNMDDKVLVHMDAIIGSMTKVERTKPGLLNAKRKRRVAIGSGTTVQEVNKVLKMHKEMSTAMKRIKKMGGIKGLMKMFGGGDMPGGDGTMPPGGVPGLPGMPDQGVPPGLDKLLKR